MSEIYPYGPTTAQVTGNDIINMEHNQLIAKMSGELGRLEHIIRHLMSTPPASGDGKGVVDKVRTIALSLGWGIGVHGSMRRDFDLIAVPWTKEAASWLDLKMQICGQLGYRELDRDTQRPHGRRTALLVEKNATHEQELHNRGEFVGPPDPKGQWIPPAIDMSFVDLRVTPPPATAQGWVACSERYPDMSRYVAAYSPERLMAFQATWNGKHWTLIGEMQRAYQTMPPITHWCPMPTMNPPEHKP